MKENFVPEKYHGEWVFRQDTKEWTFDFSIDSSGMWKTETHSEDNGYEFKRFVLKSDNHESNLTLTQKISDAKYTFHIDGLPHQGNTTLRNLMLRIFQEINVPSPLLHDTEITKQSINNNEIVLLTIRDPYESIASLFSEHLQREENKLELHDFLSSGEINFYHLTRIINYYNRWTNFVLQNHHNIHIIGFEKIKQMHKDYEDSAIAENRTIQYFCQNYGLNVFRHTPENFAIKSSVLKEVFSRFQIDSRIDSLLAPSVIIYKEAKKLEESRDK